ncbi:hypothetical protein [Psychrobacter sp. CAL346-MNA-CIBAN-0220]|uniref:hypothetical protein n=1 Tax=Psychrobacter sp. CAL346-MNA-CIBAN-0220 TaxID=3140457 RepID=UPI00331FD3E4
MIDHAIYTLCITTATALLAYVILWSGLQTFNANPSKRFRRIWPKLALYYAAYTMPIWALLLMVSWVLNLTPLFGSLSVLAVSGAMLMMALYFYTVIVQPNRLRLQPQAIDLGLQATLTVAVLADLRIGLYSGKPRHIRKLVATINALSADVVLITGDWLYYPGADLVGQLMLFKGVNKPIYTVMSTSDLRYQSVNTTKQGQPLLEDTLAAAFDVLDISYIGQQCLPLSSKCAYKENTQLTADGLSNSQNNEAAAEANAMIIAMLYGWQDLPKPLTNNEIMIAPNKEALSVKITNATQPVIILASRFDSIINLPKLIRPRPLLIAGAEKSALQGVLTGQQRQAEHRMNGKSTGFTTNSFSKKRGLYQHGSAQIFVSSGIGTRGLPFRLYRPTIDVLTIR